MKKQEQTHQVVVAYLLWIMGFMGAHRFYLGKRLTGIIWFFTLGLLGIGWLIDLFLIPSMSREACSNYTLGQYDYSLAWILLVFFGALGFHRFYQRKIGTGLLYFCTVGCFGLGLLYDYFTLNTQIEELNRSSPVSRYY